MSDRGMFGPEDRLGARMPGNAPYTRFGPEERLGARMPGNAPYTRIAKPNAHITVDEL